MTFVQRMIGAARLDARAFEEVEADRTAMGQATVVVVLASLAGGLALGQGVRGLVIGVVAGLIGWVIWAWLIYLIGTRWLPEPDTRSDTGELLRVIGFAASPGILRVVGVVPFLATLAMAVTAVWTLVAVVVGVRQALDYRSTGRAVGVCLLGWIVQIVVFAVVGFVLARPAW
jgi:hypothetical protein